MELSMRKSVSPAPGAAGHRWRSMGRDQIGNPNGRLVAWIRRGYPIAGLSGIGKIAVESAVLLASASPERRDCRHAAPGP